MSSAIKWNNRTYLTGLLCGLNVVWTVCMAFRAESKKPSVRMSCYSFICVLGVGRARTLLPTESRETEAQEGALAS